MTEPSKTPRTDALAARLEGMELNFAAHKVIRELIALAGELEVSFSDSPNLEDIAYLVWAAVDMMHDGPDDSDEAMANGWLTEAFNAARELKRAGKLDAAAARRHGQRIPEIGTKTAEVKP